MGLFSWSVIKCLINRAIKLSATYKILLIIVPELFWALYYVSFKQAAQIYFNVVAIKVSNCAMSKYFGMSNPSLSVIKYYQMF